MRGAIHPFPLHAFLTWTVTDCRKCWFKGHTLFLCGRYGTRIRNIDWHECVFMRLRKTAKVDY